MKIIAIFRYMNVSAVICYDRFDKKLLRMTLKLF